MESYYEVPCNEIFNRILNVQKLTEEINIKIHQAAPHGHCDGKTSGKGSADSGCGPGSRIWC